VPPAGPPEAPDPNARKYILVFVCEALTITALWALGRIFV
jgi:hypothetical protein